MDLAGQSRARGDGEDRAFQRAGQISRDPRRAIVAAHVQRALVAVEVVAGPDQDRVRLAWRIADRTAIGAFLAQGGNRQLSPMLAAIFAPERPDTGRHGHARRPRGADGDPVQVDRVLDDIEAVDRRAPRVSPDRGF